MVRRRRISDLSSIYNANRSVLYLNDECLLYWYTNFDNACVFGRRYSLDQVCNLFVVLEMLEFKRSMFSSYFIGALYLMNKIYDLIIHYCYRSSKQEITFWRSVDQFLAYRDGKYLKCSCRTSIKTCRVEMHT